MNPTPKPFVVLGASRGDGNTAALVQAVAAQVPLEVVDLNTLEISYFDYHHRNRDDDFLPLIRRLVEHDTVIFASPIYWYSMSAVMKTFVDRLSDLLKIEKDLGRRLRGKRGLVLATGASPNYPRSYEETFLLTFDYLSMPFGGLGYVYCENGFATADSREAVDAFVENLREAP